MKLTQLSKECLQNMPMLIDSICYTTEILGEVLDPYYDKIRDQIQKFMEEKTELKYEFDERNSERKIISIFPNVTTGRKKHLSKLDNSVSVYFSLIFYNQRRQKIINEFTVEFGYLSNSNENIIYFNLTAGEYNVDVSFVNGLAKNVTEALNRWDIQIEDGSIELRITPDQNLTDEVIENCFEDFIKYILNPVLTNLKM